MLLSIINSDWVASFLLIKINLIKSILNKILKNNFIMDDESLVGSRGVQAVKQYVCSIGMETWLLGEKVILSSFPHAER